MYSSREGVISPSYATKLSNEELEALEMWSNRQVGILPNQYHYSYEQGDTLIYPEHIRDIKIIDKIVDNKYKVQRQKDEEAAKRKQNLGNSKKGGSGFYGHTFKFNQ